MEKTLGGDRLGAGKKMKVDLHGYERSTHNLGYIWRSTMSAGTLVPFMCEVALPGDTFDINLDCDIKTHPTVGPLFGSFKAQLDIFQAPIRLYQGQLHNNKLGIGMNMSSVKLPQMRLYADPEATIPEDITNYQINPSSLLAYLGVRGVAIVDPDETALVPRQFNGIPMLAYWEIYKNYYANKQEEIGAFIHKELVALITTVTQISINSTIVPQAPTSIQGYITGNQPVVVTYSGTQPLLNQLYINTTRGNIVLADVAKAITVTGTTITFIWDFDKTGSLYSYNWDYVNSSALPVSQPQVKTFDLSQIDDMRETILNWAVNPSEFIINDVALEPYASILNWVGSLSPYLSTQEGLGIKTYQSDLFNNWLSTEWIDGSGGINDITAIDTSGGSFNIDTLNLSKKVYDMLNRIAVSGGSYDDWLDAVYTHDRYIKSESPIYHGGLIKELVFQEVVSNSTGSDNANIAILPLGTLAGKGTMSKKHKGGQVTVKVDEPSYIIGIVSLTPRVDYSQGNKWDTGLTTMDDFHKPALDEIGFQELITEQMAWWTTYKLEATPGFIQRSAGKQPAWINYMTNVNQVYGNFAIPDNEMFMTLNRRYEWDGSIGTPNIADLTTYIDPVKYNQIFAYTALDAQNFWTQIAVDITARRKMSAKIMPNL